jgi:hypothetical protein
VTKRRGSHKVDLAQEYPRGQAEQHDAGELLAPQVRPLTVATSEGTEDADDDAGISSRLKVCRT